MLANKTAYVHPFTLCLQCEKFHTSNQRPKRNSIWPEFEIGFVWHCQHVYEYPHTRPHCNHW